MNDRVTAEPKDEDTWDVMVKVGTGRIREAWPRLLPRTKDLLTKDGFNSHGGRDTPLGLGDDTGDLAYSLGVFLEAVKAKVPMEDGDPIPACYMGDEVLHQATNLVLTRQYCDPVFTSVALHACMKHQTANAALSFHSNGGKRAETKGCLSLMGMFLTGVVFSILLAAFIGNGLVSALNHDAMAASVLAYLALGSYAAMKHLNKPDEESKWKIALTTWSTLIYRDFHVGTGHGVEQQLQLFLRQGLHVPSVLFDLCAALQQGTQYDQRSVVPKEE
jgi:hypothetical protein